MNGFIDLIEDYCDFCGAKTKSGIKTYDGRVLCYKCFGKALEEESGKATERVEKMRKRLNDRERDEALLTDYPRGRGRLFKTEG